MKSTVRWLCLITLSCGLSIVPFVLFGERIERWTESYLAEHDATAWVAVIVVGVLSSDILLPVPSSAVIAFAGSTLGFFAGVIVSWIGLTLGALGGFAAARLAGRPVAERFSSPGDMEDMRALGDRYGLAILVVTRPLPVLAEATTLMMGLTEISWRRFLNPVAWSNLGIAIAYTALGAAVPLPVAVVVSIAIAVSLLVVARYGVKAILRNAET